MKKMFIFVLGLLFLCSKNSFVSCQHNNALQPIAPFSDFEVLPEDMHGEVVKQLVGLLIKDRSFATINHDIPALRLISKHMAHTINIKKLFRDFITPNFLHQLAQKINTNNPNRPISEVALLRRFCSEEAANNLLYSISEKKDLAIYVDNIDTIRQLIVEGVDLDAISEMCMRNTPLTRAIGLSKSDVVAVLLAAGADPNIPDGTLRRTPLQIAYAFSFLSGNQMIDALLKAGADPTIPDINGNSPLRQAMSKRDFQAIKYLMKDAGFREWVQAVWNVYAGVNWYRKAGGLFIFTLLTSAILYDSYPQFTVKTFMLLSIVTVGITTRLV